MVKLQKRYAYTYNKKDHYKHVINVPEAAIEKVGWKDGEELTFFIENDKIIFTKQKKGEKK